ncbi:dnaJ protein ERDJ2-like [Prosopis cineraria]|uniref:dnaJ protein ERDJ2-like n=1 Tax=Prosopis cineraria TaxID=364024 RepID=UPI00240F0E0B|nr:dnaJ protein ERDJ2-like [Prosopis cineraria]
MVLGYSHYIMARIPQGEDPTAFGSRQSLLVSCYPSSETSEISNVSTCSNLTSLLLWVVMIVLVHYIKDISREIQVFHPFSLIGLEPGAPESEIKKKKKKGIRRFLYSITQIKIQTQVEGVSVV